MSDELLEAETPPVPKAKASGPSPATIIGLALLAAVIGCGLYVGSFWQAHSSRTARLKAKNGDFVQLEHRGEIDEFAPPKREAAEGGRGGSQVYATREVKEPAWYDPYLEELFPKPIQIVYWKNPSLGPEDINLLMEFSELEALNVTCDKIESTTIEKFLTLPKLRRLRIQSSNLDASTIESWKIDPKITNVTLVNPKWSGDDMKKISDGAKANAGLKDKLDMTTSTGPSFGGN